MRTFLTVSVGPRPQDARPLFASDDPALVGVVIQAIFDRLGLSPSERGQPSPPARRGDLRPVEEMEVGPTVVRP